MNLRSITWKSFCEHFSSWKNVSLFEKAFLISALVTCGMLFTIFVPLQTSDAPGPFNEVHPFFESVFIVWWIMPLGMLLPFLMRIGLYPGNEDTGLWGGIWTLAFVNTFFWAFIFWLFARTIKLIKSKLTSVSKM